MRGDVSEKRDDGWVSALGEVARKGLRAQGRSEP